MSLNPSLNCLVVAVADVDAVVFGLRFLPPPRRVVVVVFDVTPARLQLKVENVILSKSSTWMRNEVNVNEE